MVNFLKRSAAALLTALLLIALSLVGLKIGVLATWQESLSDKLFLPRSPHGSIVILKIDDKSLQAFGRWPWDRERFAELINLIGPKAAVIGLDVSFFESSNLISDRKLANSFKDNKVIVAAEAEGLRVEQGELVVVSVMRPPQNLLGSPKIGLINVIGSSDGVVRKIPFRVTHKNDQIKSFAQAVVDQYTGSKDIPLLESGAMRINYIGKPGSFISYPIADVLSGKVSPEGFAGKIVLIGATAPDLHDNQPTPVSKGQQMSGIEIHANAIQTLLERKFLQPEQFLATALTLLVSIVILCVIFFGIKVKFGLLIVLSYVACYLIYAFYAFDNGIIKNLIYPPLVASLAFISSIGYKYTYENKQKQFIKKAFSYYLSKDVLNEVLRDPGKLVLGGERKQMTVLFTDIASFTSIAERIDPVRLSLFLNKYLMVMTKLVFAHDGVLDKYIGDSVMAFWGAPIINNDHALLACRTALEMQEELGKMIPEWREYEIDDLGTRIGINSGEMVVGNMGSQIRFDYTVVGDNVNLGSRLEGLNKEYGTKILISEGTHKQVLGLFTTRLIDVVAVKGKEQGVNVYELLHEGKPTRKEQVLLDGFEKGRLLYFKGRFKDALGVYNSLAKAFPGDAPIGVYIKRCRQLLAERPKDWDGVYRAVNK